MQEENLNNLKQKLEMKNKEIFSLDPINKIHSMEALI